MLLFGAALVAIYFLPAIVGRKKRQFPSILLTNIFFGWTFVGWLVAMIWAASPDAAK
jgi:hypothetical protein